MNFDRRDFVKFGLGLPFASASARANGFFARPPREPAGERVLIILQMTGGNDGLNTCIPIEDDLYHRARPRLRIPKESAIRLDEHAGLHPAMHRLAEIYKNGEFAIIQNVGYPQPDRSHFRSMEIWHCGSTDPARADSGWIGKLNDSVDGGGRGAAALHVGSTELPLSLVGGRSVTPSLTKLDRALLAAGAAGAALAQTASVHRESKQSAWLARQASAAYEFSAKLKSAAAAGRTNVNYPNSPLAKKLYTISQLMNAGFDARIYYLEIDGFDTHAGEAQLHTLLLRELDESVAAFWKDIRSMHRERGVAMLMFSEFGRRLRENASGGTDHGAAAPVFLLGGGIRAGMHGDPPDLAHLDDGDVTMKIDFRRVYASAMRDWLDVDPSPVLDGAFPSLPLFS
ncbi:MAG: DUF1501 domain-containing protein [Planctomycetes bacterium]|nr:DUF1501 domain-containing protein [Planctomycetota bacterium]